ncbi:hypothetical protein [Leptospira alstonii]|uniref:Uncharacterized protein n=1 Tax=Leptospira alstonii serovar Sichuan str. 79601 TaxID=1218565 RepID=M6D2N1_9LEPT|nr:hypothetical protein [Leptospira alstonii]AGS80456.1 hypothetical protein LEP1GSC193_0760 [Leptospira phage vB_LalZ_80412-LE1]EMJ95438.1 hypothetical protein LEP1GSC194_3560 [Leptospira alstonii serovar Sichuan str. 79601]
MKYETFIPLLIEKTKSKFLSLEKNKGPKLDFESSLILIGVRGISVCNNEVSLNDNDFDSFNDVLFNIYPGGKSWGSRVVTLDPGKVSKETLLKYGIKNGESRTEEGVYLVKLGNHRGHVAIVQGSPFYFRRDENGDHIWNELDPIYFDCVGLNIHAQGTLKNYVGVSSLGCTVTKATWKDSEWIELISVFKGAELSAKKKNPNFPGFCYAVLNQDSVKDILLR